MTTFNFWNDVSIVECCFGCTLDVLDLFLKKYLMKLWDHEAVYLLKGRWAVGFSYVARYLIDKENIYLIEQS